ncbi:MAG: acyl-CoA dehydrogenase [Deltaproteobacteria bacterium]|nr:acyl-CoA dehydrogenase [Deltaproteobacteria bacterium]
MEFKFTEQEAAFREEVESFLTNELPSDWAEKSMHWPGGYGTLEYPDEEQKKISVRFKKKLAEKGWLTIAWPSEYGGKEHTYMEQAIFDERTSYYRAPGWGIGTGIAGPTILAFGTEQNKQDWISRIASAEIEMWLGYSEPNAGSDLSSIETTAIEEGDHYIINGQKTWSTVAHLADYAWMIVRTDPGGHRHKSISMIVVDNKSPGMTIRPLINIAGEHSFNEVFFDNVKVPKGNLIGEKNMGFYYLMTALDFERLFVGIGSFKRGFEQFLVYINENESKGQLSVDQSVRRKLAEIATKIEVGYMFFWRTAEMLDKGQIPSVESSALKLVTTELSRNLADITMEILGPHGLLMPGSKWAAFKGLSPRGYLDCISATIGAGTSEIQRNIIATRGLGLPTK